DAERDVEIGRDRLAGLPDLLLVRPPARVGDRAGRTERRAEDVREGFDLRPALGTLEPAPTGHDDPRFAQRDAAAARRARLEADEREPRRGARGDSGQVRLGRTVGPLAAV